MTSQIYSFGVIGSVLPTSGPNLPASPFAISCVCVHTWLDGWMEDGVMPWPLGRRARRYIGEGGRLTGCLLPTADVDDDFFDLAKVCIYR